MSVRTRQNFAEVRGSSRIAGVGDVGLIKHSHGCVIIIGGFYEGPGRRRILYTVAASPKREPGGAGQIGPATAVLPLTLRGDGRDVVARFGTNIRGDAYHARIVVSVHSISRWFLACATCRNAAAIIAEDR
jgi:hypothetical protein